MLKRNASEACLLLITGMAIGATVAVLFALVIMGALVWLIAWSMAGESESEKRRILISRQNDRFAETLMSQTQIRHAA